MKITIVGGGNIGTQFAVHCASKMHDVTLYTSHPELFDGQLSIVDDTGVITHQGKIRCATYKPEEAFFGADLIIVTVPAMMMRSLAKLIFEHSNSKTIIGVVPGNGGSECAFRECIDRGNVFFGLERVAAIARLIKRGSVVKSTRYREELHVAALPSSKADFCANLISHFFDIRTTVIPNYLNLTMTPSNPILHTARLYAMFSAWHKGIMYDSVPLFYEQWNNEASELLFACDDEVQEICKKLPEFQLQHVKSLKEHYESPTIEKMTEKISSIQSFHGILTPMVSLPTGGFVPDLHSRYFTSDFSFGLKIIKQVGTFAGVSTPNIDMILNWYNSIAEEKDSFDFMDYGIDSLDALKQFYLR